MYCLCVLEYHSMQTNQQQISTYVHHYKFVTYEVPLVRMLPHTQSINSFDMKTSKNIGVFPPQQSGYACTMLMLEIKFTSLSLYAYCSVHLKAKVYFELSRDWNRAVEKTQYSILTRLQIYVLHPAELNELITEPPAVFST